jgi:hypothetical protein
MKKTFLRYFTGFLFFAFLVIAFPAGTRVAGIEKGSSSYIEVCQGTVYLPPGTKYVTCHGKKMKVISVVPADGTVQVAGDCYCPNCCGGVCAVTVSCQAPPEEPKNSNDTEDGKRDSDGGGLCVAYLSCGD